MRFLIDENFNQRVLRGLKQRIPGLDYLIVQETELRQAEDPTILAWAAEQSRILITHDKDTIPGFAYERVRANQSMPGVILVPEELSIGRAIDELLILMECSDQSEYENLVVHLPL
jgi:predicted nuclease of predicted toxin-antitoxin system